MNLVLVLLSALLHAGWNLSIKLHPDPLAATAVVVALAGAIAASVATADTLVSAAMPFGPGGGFTLALLCGVSEALYFICLGRALRDGSLSVSYLVARGGAILLLWPMAFLAQGESANPLQVFGIGLMVVGMLGLYPPVRARADRAAYLWASGAALFVAANHVLYKAALSAGGRPWPVFALAMAIATPVNLVLLGRATFVGRALDAFRAAPRPILSAALQCSIGFGLALVAMKSSGAAWVGTLRNTSVALAPLLGYLFLDERPSRRALTGITAVVVATALLAL